MHPVAKRARQEIAIAFMHANEGCEMLSEEELRRAESLAELYDSAESTNDAWKAYALLPNLVAEIKRLKEFDSMYEGLQLDMHSFLEGADEAKYELNEKIKSLQSKIDDYEN